VKRPHFQIDTVGSHFGLESKAVEEAGDHTHDEEADPRDGS
jgi:hypothetical protein